MLIPVEKAPGFHIVAQLDPELFSRIFRTYHKYLRDGESWITFANWLRENVLFVNENGWIVFSDIVPGASATMHGGCWNLKRSVPDEFKQLCKVVMEEYNLYMLCGATPEFAKSALKFLQRLGAEFCGYQPYAGVWNGEPHDVVLSKLEKEKL